MDIDNTSSQLLLVVGIIVLSIAGEKCRKLIMGEEASQGYDRFTFLNCFDMGIGTLVCLTKEALKVYLHYVRANYVSEVRKEATEVSFEYEILQGKSTEEATELSIAEGDAVARQAMRQAKHLMTPGLFALWDLFETIYVGGGLGKGLARGIGTFMGAYVGGYIGENKYGKLGFIVGSHLGCWVGGRSGPMLYHVFNGVDSLLHLARFLRKPL
ncbi:hypothetical protein RJ641_030796 [Dillenia turbinata]|uniref:Uncharacterized protein n=1 Tax=Dillenia turbinata TaxID=194707 RepID=A0AAN8VZT7_9MAGN